VDCGLTYQFHSWAQAADELLEDLYVPRKRMKKHWFLRPFMIVDAKELATLGEEREAIRNGRRK